MRYRMRSLSQRAVDITVTYNVRFIVLALFYSIAMSEATIYIDSTEVPAADFLEAVEEAETGEEEIYKSEGESGAVRVVGDSFHDGDAELYIDGEYVGFLNVCNGHIRRAREAVEEHSEEMVTIGDVDVPAEDLRNALEELPEDTVEGAWATSNDVLVSGDGFTDGDVDIHYGDENLGVKAITALRRDVDDALEDGGEGVTPTVLHFEDSVGDTVTLRIDGDMKIFRDDGISSNDHTVFFNNSTVVGENNGWDASVGSGDAEPPERFEKGWHYVDVTVDSE